MKRLLKFNEWIDAQNFDIKDYLVEGGGYGHLQHVYDDVFLTFGDLRELINITVDGLFTKDNFVQEKCLHPDTIVHLENNGDKTIKDVVDNKIKDNVLSWNDVTNEPEYKEILAHVKNQPSSIWMKIEMEDGKTIVVTPNHRMFTKDGEVKAEQLKEGDELVIM